jgi:hypothetical protein
MDDESAETPFVNPRRGLSCHEQTSRPSVDDGSHLRLSKAHSCSTAESGRVRLVIDPYSPKTHDAAERSIFRFSGCANADAVYRATGAAV